jgi:CheY-like chemotaxis protein
MTEPHRVLVVDDDREIRETVVEVLGDKGFEAVGAADGAEALAVLRDDPDRSWCLVLLDLMMPVMDGRAFRTAQMSDPVLSRIPVVVVSAVADVGSEAHDLQVDAHMTKPVKLAELVDLVEQFCQRAVL